MSKLQPGEPGERGEGKCPVPHQQVDGCLVEPGRHGVSSEAPRLTAPDGTDKSTERGGGIWGPLGPDGNSPPLEGTPPELEGKSDGHEDSQSHPQAPGPPEAHGPGGRQKAHVAWGRVTLERDRARARRRGRDSWRPPCSRGRHSFEFGGSFPRPARSPG